MIVHLVKLVWNRKTTNLLIVAEIFFAFLVVFAVATLAVLFLGRYRQPLGYDISDVWQIEVQIDPAIRGGGWGPGEAATFQRLLSALSGMPEVVAAAGASTAPYKASQHVMGWKQDGRTIDAEVTHATPGLREVLRLQVEAGRWLGPEDDALDVPGVVVDEELAWLLAGDDDPLGHPAPDGLRIVGVMRDYRRAGELSQPFPHLFAPARLGAGDGQPLRTLLVRVAPGTPAAFEEPMLEALQAIARDWSFQVTWLATARQSALKARLVPLAAAGVVAGFLMAMVVLGLTGVMWQNVTRRTRELGLRRAVGAHRARIHRQIVGEVMVLAGLGLVAGAAVALQVPVLGPFTFLGYGTVLPGLAVAGSCILSLAALCGLYPGWSATRIRPAEALRYE